jgi:hypothetical protein
VDLLARLSEESFKPLVGESFVVSQGAKRLVSLTLVSVVTATSPTPASGTRSALLSGNKTTSKSPAETLSGFSLHFKGSGKMLEQGTYTFKNGQLGKFPLFIVQGGPGMNPNTYTATFCQLVS